MLWGMILAGRSYGLSDWLVASLVTLGSADFMLTGPTSSRVNAGSSGWEWPLIAPEDLRKGM